MIKIIFLSITLGAVLMFGCGCQFKGGHSNNKLTNPKGANSKNIWHPSVRTVSIYPSTRVVRGKNGFQLRVTIQLIDVMGDPIKAPGKLRLALFKDPSGNDNLNFLIPGSELGKWEVNLETLQQQEKYYSPVTDGYVLPLNLSGSYVPGNSVLLKVAFTTPTGQRIKVQRKLPIKW